MEVIQYAFSSAYEIMNYPIELFGYVISLWQVFLFACLGTLIIWFLRNLFE